MERHISRAKDPEIVEESQKFFGVTTKILLSVFALILIFIFLSSIKSCGKKVGKKVINYSNKVFDVSTSKKGVTASPAVKKMVRETRKFEIPESGLKVYLYPGWKINPLDGKITITTPSGKVFHDYPGLKRNVGNQPEGIYLLHSDPKGSRKKVEITNKWKQ